MGREGHKEEGLGEGMPSEVRSIVLGDQDREKRGTASRDMGIGCEGIDKRNGEEMRGS